MTGKKKTKYLIIGQGLAGTLLAYFLEKEGMDFLVIDNNHIGSSTKAAAGIINPITGRRYVKSWKIDDLLPFAKATYREMEKKLSIDLYHRKNVIRTLFNNREVNDWQSRAFEEGYRSYMLDKADLGPYKDHTVQAFDYGEVDHAAQVDIAQLIEAYRIYLQKKGQLLTTPFNHNDLDLRNKNVAYQGIEAEKIIFCEGHQAVRNPYFNYLPFGGAKGEVLIVRIPGASFEKMLKHRIFIVPLPDELYWIGATYDWTFDDDQPTDEGKSFLEERLKDFLKLPFEVVEHWAAVRPTVKDRRPFLGQHPEFNPLYIFNGLGTKGASLGPFFAQQLIHYLSGNGSVDPEVNINRFK